MTVTVKLHELALPIESEEEQVTVVVPLAKAEPEAGEQVTVREPSQMSLANGVAKVTAAVHKPASVLVVILVGHPVNTGP